MVSNRVSIEDDPEIIDINIDEAINNLSEENNARSNSIIETSSILLTNENNETVYDYREEDLPEEIEEEPPLTKGKFLYHLKRCQEYLDSHPKFDRSVTCIFQGSRVKY